MCLQDRKKGNVLWRPAERRKRLCKIALPNWGEALAYLVALTPVNIGAPCESCCIEHMCRVDLHAASPVIRDEARSTKPCVNVITRQHQK